MLHELADLIGAATLGEEAGQIVLVGSKCTECGTETVPVVDVCPSCASEDVTPTPQPRDGLLYSMTTLHVGPEPWLRPMTLGYVDLSNGVRVLGALQGDGHKIGGQVVLSLGKVGVDADGSPVRNFVFVPVEQTDD
jgi:uncharacterized OB-fold protein